MQNNDIEKKVMIKAAAKDLFFRFGYSKTSMTDIARQCDLAKPTLYYYYKNKEEIFDEVVIDEAQSFMDEVEKKIPAHLPADQRLAAFLTAIYNGKKFYADKLADVPDYLWRHSPQGHPITKKLRDMFRKRLIQLLQAGKQEGVFNFTNEHRVADTLTHLLEFLNYDWMRHYPETYREEIIEQTIEIILNGLKRSAS